MLERGVHLSTAFPDLRCTNRVVRKLSGWRVSLEKRIYEFLLMKTLCTFENGALNVQRTFNPANGFELGQAE